VGPVESAPNNQAAKPASAPRVRLNPKPLVTQLKAKRETRNYSNRPARVVSRDDSPIACEI
jgi:hypothetical protein